MNTEMEYLLRVLRGFLSNEDPGVFTGDWENLISLADRHGVTGILGYQVMRFPNDSNRQVLPRLRATCLQTITVFSRRGEAMKALIEKLNDAGIEHLIFKGYILREYYPVPELRTFGDVDFLIRREDRETCDTLLVREGFLRKADWEPVFSYYRGAEYYEVHTDVMEVDVSDKADYVGYFRQIWDHAHKVSSHTWELSSEFHLIYMLTHIAKHISGSGAGIRMYMDIAVFLRHFRGKLDWTWIRDQLEVLSFSDFANMVFTLVKECFGEEVPFALREIDPQVFRDFLEYTMAGGAFGHFGRDAGLVSLKNQNTGSDEVSRLGTFLHRSFPPVRSLEKRYVYLQDKPWLLPVAWVDRIIRTKDKWAEHANEAKSIMQTDTEEVLKLRRIYKELGL